MAQRPADDEAALHEWFWGATGLAALIRVVATRMAESDDPGIRNYERGLVR
jgi:hypothetical protein